MPTLDSLPVNTARKIMLFGAPKVGKTALVGKLATDLTLWWFDLERGVSTLLNPAILPADARKNIRVFQLPDLSTYPIAAETITKVLRGGEQKICAAHGKVSCLSCMKNEAEISTINLSTFTSSDVLVIDSVTQLANSVMNYICRDKIAKDELYKPEWEDYRKQGSLMDAIFSRIQQANYHVICISHDVLAKKEDGKEKLVPIGGTNNFSATCAKYFDEVIHMDIVNKKHKAISTSTSNSSILTGSRTGLVLDAVENLSLLPLFKS